MVGQLSFSEITAYQSVCGSVCDFESGGRTVVFQPYEDGPHVGFSGIDQRFWVSDLGCAGRFGIGN